MSREFRNPLGDDARLWELLHCIGDSPDGMRELLEDFPELAALMEDGRLPEDIQAALGAMQSADRDIGQAMRGVEPPEGLAERILAGLHATNIVVDGDVVPPMDAPLPVKGKAVSTRPGIRWSMVAVAASLFAVAAILFFATRPASPEPLYLASVAEAALVHFDGENELFGKGMPLSARPAPEGFPLGRCIRTDIAEPRWREVPDFLGREAVAYDIASSRGTIRATVYVLPAEYLVGDVLSDIPPDSPLLQTRNRSVSLWRSSDMLYVVVVEGDASRYRMLLDLPTGPLT